MSPPRPKELNLLIHQAKLVQDTTTREIALVGGRGAGKSHSLAYKLVTLSGLHAGLTGFALAPTVANAKKNIIPALHECLSVLGLKYKFNKSEGLFLIPWNDKQSQIQVLGAENIAAGLGANIAYFGVDECDVMRLDTAKESWQKLSGAVRAGDPKHQQKIAVSTPEGYNFLYQYFVQDNKDGKRKLIHARSYDNPFLPDAFFTDLLAQYPKEYIAAYLEGQFVNLDGKTVYSSYHPEFNNTSLTLDDIVKGQEILYIGADFNVDGMSAIVSVIRGNTVYVIKEFLGDHDTRDLVTTLKSQLYGHSVYVYPDPSGASARSSATSSDIAILQVAGFSCIYDKAAPPVKNRVNAVNGKFCNGNDERSLFVNINECPGLHKSLITQTWKNGSPLKNVQIGLNSTKKTFIDGPLDALGYFIWKEFPIKEDRSYKTKIEV